MGKTLYLEKITSYKLEEKLREFKAYMEASDRGSSVVSYTGDIQKLANWLILKYGSFNAGAVTPLDLVEYRKYLQKNGGRKGGEAKPATVNRALISLKVFLGWLVENKEIKDNPARGIKPVTVATTPAPKWLDRNEQNRFFREVRESSSRDEAIVGLMLHAGLRISEVCALSRGDLHIGERAGKVTVRQGKGNKYREVPLNVTVRKILERWLEENPEGPLFPNHHGRSISVRGVRHLISGYAYKAKVEGVSPHTFRHTFCKTQIDMGTPIDQVAMMAGHSTLDITKRYTAPSMADLQAAVERAAWE